ncbi:MAG TPA: hypothetical protein VID50_05685 [Candidatus Eisenbacteria bacterium]
MKRVVLFHWNAAEARERAGRLRRSGYAPVSIGGSAPADLRSLRADPPDAVVIDLGRVPSLGRDVAAFLRQQRGTRLVPIVFVGGAPEKVARVRQLFPKAVYATWPGIAAGLRRALRAPPAQPTRPGALAGYSGTPLPRKLGITPGSQVALLGAPAGFEGTLGPLPSGVAVRRGARSSAKVVLLFARSAAELERRFRAAGRALRPGGRLWILWPKRTSGTAGRLGQRDVRAFGLARNYVDYKICAVDGTWSGLCFARQE